MENKVGQEFDGTINGVASFGFFVELPNTIEGLIPLRYMEDDFYKYDADTMSLHGENTGKIFALGMPVHIKVRDVNIPKRQITFDYLGKAGKTEEPETITAEIVSETVGEPVDLSADTNLPVATAADLPEVVPADLPAVEPDDLPAITEEDLPEVAPEDLPEVVDEEVTVVKEDLPAVKPEDLPAVEETLLPEKEPEKA